MNKNYKKLAGVVATAVMAVTPGNRRSTGTNSRYCAGK